MKNVVLDTNFILNCAKQKIDFFEDIKLMPLKILIPKQAIVEIKGIAKSKDEAKLALELLKNNQFKEIDLKTKNVDQGIINLARKDKNIVVATLDKELKGKIKNPKLIIREKKRLEIV